MLSHGFQGCLGALCQPTARQENSKHIVLQGLCEMWNRAQRLEMLELGGETTRFYAWSGMPASAYCLPWRIPGYNFRRSTHWESPNIPISLNLVLSDYYGFATYYCIDLLVLQYLIYSFQVHCTLIFSTIDRRRAMKLGGYSGNSISRLSPIFPAYYSRHSPNLQVAALRSRQISRRQRHPASFHAEKSRLHYRCLLLHTIYGDKIDLPPSRRVFKHIDVSIGQEMQPREPRPQLNYGSYLATMASRHNGWILAFPIWRLLAFPTGRLAPRVTRPSLGASTIVAASWPGCLSGGRRGDKPADAKLHRLVESKYTIWKTSLWSTEICPSAAQVPVCHEGTPPVASLSSPPPPSGYY